MPSIRRSLIGYFLLLLGLALTGVGVLVDTFARSAMQAREEAETRRIQDEIANRKMDAQARFNSTLLQRATAHGTELRRMFVSLGAKETDRAEIDRFRVLMMASAVGAHVTPGGRLLGASLESAAGPSSRWPTSWYWVHARAKTDAEVRKYFADADDHPGYFQFQFPIRISPILGPSASGLLPPLDVARLNRRTDFEPYCEDVTVNGVLIRRGVVKAPILPPGWPLRGGLDLGRGSDPVRNTRFMVGNGSGAIGDARMAVGGGSGPVGELISRNPNPDPLPFVYIQFGLPKNQLLTEYEQLDQECVDRLATLATEVRDDQSTLRLRLLTIFGLTFVALAVGGWTVVGRGLAPVGRLTEAVSRVSEKDFRLPVEKASLSVELLPIHDRLTHTLGALRRAFEREKQAVADISHELRTPLAGLLATIDVSLRKPRTADQYKATLGECRDIGKQLNRLVERILTLARMDAGQGRHRAEPTDLGELAGGCATVVRPLAEAHDLTLSTDITPGLVGATDPDMLREVVTNLLSNAVEYTEPGGRIELSVRPAGGGRAVIAVRDTGIGMTPEVADKVFERFYRADPSRHTTGVHAGLGLAIVKEYVTRLGGTVGVTSRPGEGSTFTVTLPATRVPEPAAV
jgi:signal transduction histidine kinase